MNLLATPLGWIMKGCYLLVKNYGIALLMFTILTRIITLPVNIKQQMSQQRMNMLQPELEKLKQKYGKNPEKYNEEMMKLYSKHNVNPMASCLPMLLPLILLWAMIPVVYKPLTYISNADRDHITADENFIRSLYTISAEVDKDGRSIETLLEGADAEQRAEKLGELLDNEENYPNSFKLLSNLGENDKSRVINALANEEGLDGFITNPDYFSENLMRGTYGPQAVMFNFDTKADGRYIGLLNSDVQGAIKDLDYTFFGLDLGKIPSKTDATVVIPILSCLLNALTTVISQIFSRKNNPEMKMQGSMFTMLLMMSLLSLWIGFKFPCALGIYWIYSSGWGVIQTVFLNIFYSPAKIRELAAKEAQKAKEKRKKNGPGFMEMALEIRNEQEAADKGISTSKDKDAPDSDDDDEDADEPDYDEDEKLSKARRQERDRRKLNEARKRYAEKYGDEYKED